MNTILEKLRKARETSVEIGHIRLLLRRPTDEEASKLFSGDGQSIDVSALGQFITGWEGVTERDVLPDGTDSAVPFDGELAREWLVDRYDLWGEVARAVTQHYMAHLKARDTDPKN